jgi:Zn-finger nucleic acid-binding protein
MKCPKCGVDLLPTIRHKLKINYCQSCKGLWLEHDELEELEDEVFDFGDRWKGTLVFSSAATTHKCPECSALLQRFRYRFYDLYMEFCPNQHGYWLDDDEDTRVLELMKTVRWRAAGQFRTALHPTASTGRGCAKAIANMPAIAIASVGAETSSVADTSPREARSS